MKLKVAIYSANRSDVSWSSESLAKKLLLVRSIIDEHFGNSEFNELFTQNNQLVSGVFVLPEYFFNKTGVYGQPIPLSYEEKKEIQSFFTQIHIPGLLLIPGSFSSMNTLVPEKKEKFIIEWEQFKKEGLSGYKEQVHKKLLSEISFNIESMQKGSDLFYAKNSAYCFFSSHSTYKKVSKREALTDEYENTSFISGIQNPTFRYLGAVFGVSICRDAAEGYLDNYHQSVDIEVILSDFVTWDMIKSQITTPRTIIHASTRAEYSGVLNKEGQLVSCYQEKVVHEFPVRLYSIDIPELLKSDCLGSGVPALDKSEYSLKLFT